MTDMTAEELKKWLSVWRLIEQSVTTNQQVEQQKEDSEAKGVDELVDFLSKVIDEEQSLYDNFVTKDPRDLENIHKFRRIKQLLSRQQKEGEQTPAQKIIAVNTVVKLIHTMPEHEKAELKSKLFPDSEAKVKKVKLGLTCPNCENKVAIDMESGQEEWLNTGRPQKKVTREWAEAIELESEIWHILFDNKKWLKKATYQEVYNEHLSDISREIVEKLIALSEKELGVEMEDD
jgi:hypothetical protein